MTAARYDGHADWYHESFPGPLDEDATALTGLLGPGTGQVCLDVACGTGRYLPAIAAAGYRPLGLDLSADQLRVARGNGHGLARADARALPRPGYGNRGWAQRSTPGGKGLSTRVGFHHKTLDGFLGAFTGAGLHLTRVTELWRNGVVLPRDIAVAATRH
ncbi:MAG TPA: class I SAM-dependent methyltransferase [Streptosporangiaceae bacterium]|nr:class I SAM-dependent methyltransferase [Streptosporangiaceae bacterium]